MARRARSISAARCSREAAMACRARSISATRGSREAAMACRARSISATRGSREAAMVRRARSISATRGSREAAMVRCARFISATRGSREAAMVCCARFISVTRDAAIVALDIISSEWRPLAHCSAYWGSIQSIQRWSSGRLDATRHCTTEPVPAAAILWSLSAPKKMQRRCPAYQRGGGRGSAPGLHQAAGSAGDGHVPSVPQFGGGAIGPVAERPAQPSSSGWRTSHDATHSPGTRRSTPASSSRSLHTVMSPASSPAPGP